MYCDRSTIVSLSTRAPYRGATLERVDQPPRTRISPEIAYRRLEAHPAWVVERTRIYRDVRLPSFIDAVDLLNRVAVVAERLQHHPNLCIHEWCFVRIELYSHLENELTHQDIELAIAIDALLEQPPAQ